MVRKPHKASPDMPLEEAARLILQKKIGGLPVVVDGKLVGVITVVDILSAFITVLGMLDSSSRVDVKISSSTSPLDEITRLVQSRHGDVISICQLSAVEGPDRVYSLRLKKCDLKPIVDELKKHGFEVVSSSP
jgi:acetoin utilization protein AcuB